MIIIVFLPQIIDIDYIWMINIGKGNSFPGKIIDKFFFSFFIYSGS